jgi:hypothetical protein
MQFTKVQSPQSKKDSQIENIMKLKTQNNDPFFSKLVNFAPP